MNKKTKQGLAGGFKYDFDFHPYLGKWSILISIFQMGWNHQLEVSWFVVGLLVGDHTTLFG